TPPRQGGRGYKGEPARLVYRSHRKRRRVDEALQHVPGDAGDVVLIIVVGERAAPGDGGGGEEGTARGRLAEGEVRFDPFVLIAAEIGRHDAELLIDQEDHRRMILRGGEAEHVGRRAQRRGDAVE